MGGSLTVEQNGECSMPLSRREEDSVRVWISAASRAEDEEKQEQMAITIAERFKGGYAVYLK